GSKNPQNTNGDAAFEIKEPKFEGRKPEFEIHVSLSSSNQTEKHDDKTKRKAKGKSHVESSTGYRNLSTKFEDFSNNSINEVNTADSLVPAVGKLSTNNTNTSSAARRRKGDKGKGIMVHEPKSLKKKTQIEQDEAYVRELEAELNKNIDWAE
nr:hypothetical protein [Tanacetum cinerariifolium]